MSFRCKGGFCVIDFISFGLTLLQRGRCHGWTMGRRWGVLSIPKNMKKKKRKLGRAAHTWSMQPWWDSAHRVKSSCRVHHSASLRTAGLRIAYHTQTWCRSYLWSTVPEVCTAWLICVSLGLQCSCFCWVASLAASCTGLSVKNTLRICCRILLRCMRCFYFTIFFWINLIFSSLRLLAKQVCEPNWQRLSNDWEDHQPGCPEDFRSTGERLWPHLFNHHQQTGTGQVKFSAVFLLFSFTLIKQMCIKWI